MGASSSKQDVMAKIAELDQQELEMNLKLKDMQVELNGMLPKEERIKVNQSLNANTKIKYDYFTPLTEPKPTTLKKKKNEKTEKSKKPKSKGDKKKKK